jgi:zinc transport system substrate-binding protein
MKHLASALTGAALLLAGCAGTSGSDDGRPSVVASFYPFAFVAERVGGSFVSVDNLTSPGVEPHDIELTPQQVARVQDADVVIYEDEFQAAVDDAVDQADRDDDATVDVSDLVTEVGDDPHTWLDPQTMVTVTRAVAETLSAAAPAHAKEFGANADELVDELDGLDTAFSEGLQTCERRTIVTSHAAFAYLADRYDLTQVPIAGLDPSNEPSPRDLADITQLVRSEGITTIFTEELVSPAVARTVANETGADTATLDPIEGLGEDTSDETYLTLMRRNLEAIRTANSCQ